MSETYTIDWQTKDQSPEEYLHIKEFTDFKQAKLFLQKLRADEDVAYIVKDAISVHDEAGRFVRYEEVPIEEFTAIKTTPNCIDNFPVIDSFLQFEQGSFYKFELLIRNTDGNNPLYQEGYSNTNKNILIKSWYIDTKEYYEKMKHEMVTLSNITGARLYVTLDRKDNVKLVQNLLHSYTDSLVAICNGQKPSIKSISKTFASETSKVENSSKGTKTIMFDVDTKDLGVKQLIESYIKSKKVEPYILETKKGYHIFCYKKFNIDNWKQECRNAIELEWQELEPTYTSLALACFENYVSVKENELGLVYHPMKNEQSFYDKLYNLVEPYVDDFTGYNEKEHGFDIIQAVEEILENECTRKALDK